MSKNKFFAVTAAAMMAAVLAISSTSVSASGFRGGRSGGFGGTMHDSGRLAVNGSAFSGRALVSGGFTIAHLTDFGWTD